MNKMFLIVFAVLTGANLSHAQNSTISSPATLLLSVYYNLKDALVAGNSTTAAAKANAFVKAANGIDFKIISEGNINNLLKYAGKISGAKDIEKQREYFSILSSNMITLAKAVKQGSKPVYLAYCPMKKASWLTSEKEIKNPYYGSSMLTCGVITETLQ
jgi:hypothetical protein